MESVTILEWWVYAAVIIASLFIIFIIFSVLRHRRFLGIIIKTFRRDLSGLTRFILTFKSLGKYERAETSVGEVFEATVARHPGKICFQFENHTWTFLEVQNYTNQIANYFQRQGYTKGDVVALFMDNRPEFVCVWLGLSKIGVVTSLINSHLRLLPLKHSFEISKPKAVIFGTELFSAVKEVKDNGLNLAESVSLYALGSLKGVDVEGAEPGKEINFIELDKELQNESTDTPKCVDEPKFSDNLFYIFTSGTTGLPKAAIVRHSRFVMGSVSFHHMNNLKSDDVIYVCLPLYHTAGGLCGVGQGIFYGNTVILRRKFSASKFWKDCATNNVTVAQYIGEICRYLLNQPFSRAEQQHRIRAMIGNGLRTELWKEFVHRFNIRQISEIYGSTDGNCNFVNFDGRIGAVGFVPVILQKLYPMGLIRVDEVTGEVMRDPKTGLALRCKSNEPGELVGKIVQNHPIREFQGYAGSSNETNKKVLHNVFAKGDRAFRTGDLLIMDEYGYFYFKDRVGDTFRWKGENVSTAEVEAVVSSITHFKACVAYGVQIPGTEGRAGMVAIVDPEKTTDLDDLAEGVNKNLPQYARPIFVRLSKDIEMTSTHKIKKLELQKEGFALTRIEDPLYVYLDGKYTRLDEELLGRLLRAEIRL